MKHKLFSHALGLMLLSMALPVLADEANEKQIYLSEIEAREVFSNPTRSYVYIGKEASDIANIIKEVSQLEEDQNTPIWGLKSHIDKGFCIGLYDAVAQALEQADKLLKKHPRKLDADKTQALSQSLNNVITLVTEDRLTLDAEVLSFLQDKVDVPASNTATRDGLRLLVINEKMHVHGKATFYKNVTFKENINIIGGIFQNGVSFIQNFPAASNNTFVGINAGNATLTGINNTAIGANTLTAITSGSNNIALGSGAGSVLTTGNNNIYIGLGAVAAGESNVTRIANIRGVTTGVANAIAVLIDSTGQLGTASSTRRVKHDIQSMADDSAAIYNLNPVSFVYNGDASETKQYGLIAEEVSDVFPAIVVYDQDGQPFTVQYHVLPVLLLNEIQKLAARVTVLEQRS